jgi:hypothetical protein
MLSYKRTAIRTVRLGLVGAMMALSSCMMFMKPPADLDYARVRVSEAGLYRATIKPEGDSIPQGKLQKWTLHLETIDGVPVDLAKVTVDGGMPQHRHGLPTKPIVTRQLGNGDHPPVATSNSPTRGRVKIPHLLVGRTMGS